jgi:hypothetical protein
MAKLLAKLPVSAEEFAVLARAAASLPADWEVELVMRVGLEIVELRIFGPNAMFVQGVPSAIASVDTFCRAIERYAQDRNGGLPSSPMALPQP